MFWLAVMIDSRPLWGHWRAAEGGGSPRLPFLPSVIFIQEKGAALWFSRVLVHRPQTTSCLSVLSLVMSQGTLHIFHLEKKTHTQTCTLFLKGECIHLRCRQGFAVICFNKTKSLKCCLWPLKAGVSFTSCNLKILDGMEEFVIIGDLKVALAAKNVCSDSG